eukprot:13744794-Alexandrium_andersonii.AAC.1
MPEDMLPIEDHAGFLCQKMLTQSHEKVKLMTTPAEIETAKVEWGNRKTGINQLLAALRKSKAYLLSNQKRTEKDRRAVV